MIDSNTEQSEVTLEPCPLGHHVSAGLRVNKTDPRIACLDCGLTLAATDWFTLHERWNTRRLSALAQQVTELQHRVSAVRDRVDKVMERSRASVAPQGVIEGPSSTEYEAWLETRPDITARFETDTFKRTTGYEIWRNSWLRLRELVTAAASVSTPVSTGEQHDGWVTFGRVKVDIENETETFERTYPPAVTSTTPEEQDGDSNQIKLWLDHCRKTGFIETSTEESEQEPTR